MNRKKEKRMIPNTGYEVKHAVHIGSREVVAAENMNEPKGDYYFVACYKDNGLIGEYSQCMIGSDYLEIMKEFTSRLSQQTENVISEINATAYQAEPITAEQCYPHNYGESIEGKIVVIKAEVLCPEYRRGDRQLVLVDGGFGAQANSRGKALYCTCLNDGQAACFERHDVLGEMKELPEWAAERLAAIKAEREVADPETVAGYIILQRIKVGDKTFVLGENANAVQRYVTWQQLEGRSGYDLGHYFSDCDTAAADLYARAGKERENTAPYKDCRNRNGAR